MAKITNMGGSYKKVGASIGSKATKAPFPLNKKDKGGSYPFQGLADSRPANEDRKQSAK